MALTHSTLLAAVVHRIVIQPGYHCEVLQVVLACVVAFRQVEVCLFEDGYLGRVICEHEAVQGQSACGICKITYRQVICAGSAIKVEAGLKRIV